MIDAYSGDSIPTHLITEEAFDLYRKALKPDGILACHLSNWHIDLWPVMKAAAKHLGFNVLGEASVKVYSEYADATSWAFLSKDPFEPRMPDCCHVVDFAQIADRPLIRDACGSMIFNIRFNYAPPTTDGFRWE